MESEHDRWILIGIGLLAAFLLWYGVFVAQQLLAIVGIVMPLLFLYLAWRFVIAHERIAAAIQTRREPSAEPRDPDN